MKITRIRRLRNYRIFRDFTWPTDGLLDFGRFNLIYGWNGTGKTSLSNTFRQMQRREPLVEGEVEVVVDGNRIAGSGFGNAAIPAIRVFNRDTVNRAVFELPNQQLPPVYFLGEDSAEKQRRIEELKKLAAKLTEEQLRLQGKKTTAQSALDSFCTEQARGIKNLLTVAGGGPYNNYDARNFKVTVEKIAAPRPTPQPLTHELRERHLATKDGRALNKIPPLSRDYPDFTALTARAQRLLRQSVVSRVLPELNENPALASWVGEGIALHTGKNATETCRFCSQALPIDRLRHLEAHFNDEFKRFQEEVTELTADITLAKSELDRFQLPAKTSLYTHLQPKFEDAAGKLTLQSGVLRNYFDALLKSVTAKKGHPFEPLELLTFFTRSQPPSGPPGTLERIFQGILAGASVIAGSLGKAAYETLDAVIHDHNKHTANFEKEVGSARSALERDEVLRAFAEWQKKGQAIGDADAQWGHVRQKLADVNGEIVELEKDVLQHRRPAEELNREMADYLGRDELRFEVEQSGYRITRNGQPATHLSESERTAIAFMYFLKSLRASDFNLRTGVVVIDDPVSSLDANSLYNAFGFMKQRTFDAGQLFVLTHNFTFFRQVLNWFRHLPGQRKKVAQRPARFYMLTSNVVNGRRTADIETLDRFLHEYESEYHYLFKRVHDESKRPTGQGLEVYYSAPNIARRLLESFLAFRVPDVAGELLQKLDSVPFDTAKKTRIIRFLHTYSHLHQVTEPGHDLSVLSEAPAILQDLLALIRATDEAHHDRMVALIAPPAEPESE